MLGRPADAEQRADVLAFLQNYEAVAAERHETRSRRARSLDQRLPDAVRLGRVPVRVLNRGAGILPAMTSNHSSSTRQSARLRTSHVHRSSPAANSSRPPPAASATWPSPACSRKTARGRDDAATRSRPSRRTSRRKAKRVIFMFMQGGPSHVDTFDYKPALERDDGKSPGAGVGGKGNRKLLKSPWKFSPARQERPADLRAVPEPRQARRRPVPAQRHAHRPAEPSAGRRAAAHRQLPVRPAHRWARGCCTAWAPRTRSCPASSRSTRSPASAAR